MLAIARILRDRHMHLHNKSNQVQKQDDSPRGNGTSNNDHQPSNGLNIYCVINMASNCSILRSIQQAMTTYATHVVQKCIFYRSCQELKDDDKNNA